MSASSRSVAPPLAKLVIFAVVTLVLTAALAQTLGSIWPSGGTSYRAEFTDVTGVLPGDDVRIAGVRVGQVTSVRLVRDTVAELTFTVDEHIALATDVHATSATATWSGSATSRSPKRSTTRAPLPAHGLIPMSQTTPALDLTVLFNGFRPLFTALTPQDVNSLAYEIIQVLQGDGGTVGDLLQHTASLTTALADRDEVISQVITNLNEVLSTLDAHRDELSKTIAQLQQFVSGLAADRDAIGTAIDNIGDLTQATASLLQQVRPDLAHDITGLGSLAGLLSGQQQRHRHDAGQAAAAVSSADRHRIGRLLVQLLHVRLRRTGHRARAGTVNPAQFSAASARCGGGN